MARSTMADLIARLRGFTSAGTDDYVIVTTNYWSDDQLQTILDQYSTSVIHEQLSQYPNYMNGSMEYKQYRSAYNNFEQTDGGSQRFVLTDSLGNLLSGYSANYDNGNIFFDTNTGGSEVYLTSTSYDIAGAAATVWESKAAYYAPQFDFATSNHSMKKSQVFENCQRMSRYYRSISPMSGAISITMARSDL